MTEHKPRPHNRTDKPSTPVGAQLLDSPPTGPHLWEVAWVRDLALVGMIVLVVWLGYYLRAIFTPVLIGLFLAYLAHPLVTYMQRRWRWPRTLTLSVLLGVTAVIIAGLLAWFGPAIWKQASTFVDKLPGYVDTLSQWLKDKLNIDTSQMSTQIDNKLKEFKANPGQSLANAASVVIAGSGSVAQTVQSMLGTVLYIAMTLALIPVYFFFFCWHFGPLVDSVEQYIPAKRREETLEILSKMNNAVATFFRGRILISLIMGVLFWAGWQICGVPYAFLLGMFAGFLNLIPYIGVVAWPLAIILKWLDATSGGSGGTSPEFDFWMIVFWPSVVYGVVQFLDGWVLTPYIQGKQLDMSAVTILIVVFVGGALGGLYGLILCLPAAACIKIVFKEVVRPRLRRWAAEH